MGSLSLPRTRDENISTGVSDVLKDAFNAALIAFSIFAGTWLLAWMLSVGWFSWLY